MLFDIFDHIDHIYYINLDKRVDRRAHVENELRAFDPTLERTTRFSAIEYAGDFAHVNERVHGAIGCSMSHIAVSKMCREKGHKNVLIVEDDFKLNVSMEEFSSLMAHFFNTVKSYYFLLLGTTKYPNVPFNFKVERVDECIYNVVYSDCTTGYIINESVYDDWIREAEEKTDSLIMSGNLAYSIDGVWNKYKDMQRYTFNDGMKHVAVQIPGYSDIEKMMK